ncbi:10968_t:CDS:10 [Funneliformis geosporum]|uniref:10968_t:CDS:1 n=1 Tax=Funneliformis geosporum TaxID=1117311 RepID=A0A9W4SCH9_9GLOM|nr:10968_t:CDS:10 [Funneliformis geosporum]
MTPKPICHPCKKFTWEELANHNKADDAYVAVRGNVYDITNFIKRHPGGEDILLFAAGRDATQAFETYHELGKPDLVLKKYFIGTLISNELPVFIEPTEFHRTLKKRVEDYFQNNQIDPKNRITIWLRYAVIFGSLIGSYYAQFFITYIVERTWLQIMFAIIMGFACAQIGLNPLHDASHFSGATHDFLNGASHLVWTYQHAFGHHIYTNIADADPDILTDDPDFRRIKPSQNWYSRYINQQTFVPLLYGLLAFKTRIQDISIVYIIGSNGKIRINPLSTWHTSIFWGGKAFFILFRIIIPLIIIPAWKFALLFVIADLVTSYWLALTFQANHVVEEVEWPLPDETGLIQKDWAEMQIVTTLDYAYDSYFWTSIVGSLNYQAVHHVFPQVSQHRYGEIAPIVKETCKEFGIPFYYKETFWDAFRSHLEHLRLMGLPPQSKGDIKVE